VSVQVLSHTKSLFLQCSWSSHFVGCATLLSVMFATVCLSICLSIRLISHT